MDETPVAIFTVPGTKILIEDDLDRSGLGLVTASCGGSKDIPAFEKRFVMYYPGAEEEARRSHLTSVSVPADGRLVYATTLFAATQYEDEDFIRECLALQLVFESEEQGDVTAGVILTMLGKVPDIPEGCFCPYIGGTVQ